MSDETDDTCDCPCHAVPDGDPDAHLMACCMPCSTCGKRIEAVLWAVHSATCCAAAGSADP